MMIHTAALPRLALTLIQPWGSLIIHYGKDVENRTWAPSSLRLQPGDRLWIHAGLKVDRDANDEASDLIDYETALRLIGPYGWPRGALLGHVRFDGITRESSSPWFMGPIGWRLSDPIALPEPVLCRGARGLWPVPNDVLARAEEVLRAA